MTDYKELYAPSNNVRMNIRQQNRDAFRLSHVLNLSLENHLQFWIGWLAWVTDAFDFFCVSLTTNELSLKFFGQVSSDNTKKLTQSITLTLLFRSVGAFVIGLLSDRFGRKWPLAITLLISTVLQLASSFCTTFESFLGVRAVFGMFMGAIWGGVVSSSLENIPIVSRGLFSGIIQEGYVVGYLLACLANLFGVERYGDYRIIFWAGSGLTFLTAILRILVPESKVFVRARERKRLLETEPEAEPEVYRDSETKAYRDFDAEAEAESRKDTATAPRKGRATMWQSAKSALIEYWPICLHTFLLTSFMNFVGHGSQDLYPVFLENSKGFSKRESTNGAIIGNCGAIFGGLVMGFASQWLGRRLTIIFSLILTGCFIPLWIMPNNLTALYIGAFITQVGVQGSWSVVPVYLNEIAPPQFRAVFLGVVYQLGNAVSSASAQIEATAGKSLVVTVDGVTRPDYGVISAVIVGVASLFVVILCLVGKEDKGKDFENGETLV